MIIRLETLEDRDAALAIERAAFDRLLEAEIVEAVRDEPGSFALVATVEDEIVGHVQMSRARVGATDVLALGPIGVRPDRQRSGIGAALVRAATEEAATRREPAVILLGDPAYYGPLGFVPATGAGLANPFAGSHDGDADEDNFQILVLTAPSSGFTGEVRWHPAFG